MVIAGTMLRGLRSRHLPHRARTYRDKLNNGAHRRMGPPQVSMPGGLQIRTAVAHQASHDELVRRVGHLFWAVQVLYVGFEVHLTFLPWHQPGPDAAELAKHLPASRAFYGL